MIRSVLFLHLLILGARSLPTSVEAKIARANPAPSVKANTPSRFPLILRFMDWDPRQPDAWQSGMNESSLDDKKVFLEIAERGGKFQKVRFRVVVRQVPAIVGDVLDMEPEYLFEVGKRYVLRLRASEDAIADRSGNLMGEWFPRDENGNRTITQNFQITKSFYGGLFMVDEDYKKSLPLVFENGRFYLPWWAGSKFWWKGVRLQPLEEPEHPNREEIKGARFTRDEQTLWMSSANGTLYVVETKTGEIKQRIEEVGSQFLFASDESFVVTGHGRSLKIYDAKTYKLQRVFTPSATGDLFSMTLSPQGNLLATAEGIKGQHHFYEGGRIKLWSIATGELMHTLKEPHGAWISPAFSPDGNTLASGSVSVFGDSAVGALKLWNVKTGEMIRRFPEQGDGISNVRFTSDGRFLMARRSRGMADARIGERVGLWNVETGLLQSNLPWRSYSEIKSAEILPTGMVMVDRGTSKTIYDPHTGLIMLNNIPTDAPDVIARSENYALKRRQKSLVLEDIKQKKIIKEWHHLK